MQFLYLVALVLSLFLTPPAASASVDLAQQSQLPARPAQEMKYPKIVLFSTSWCPHCRAAKEYFTRNNIPFINRDVELDSEAMELLTGKYKSQSVPVVVLGNDDEVMRGFSEERFEKALEKVRKQ